MALILQRSVHTLGGTSAHCSGGVKASCSISIIYEASLLRHGIPGNGPRACSYWCGRPQQQIISAHEFRFSKGQVLLLASQSVWGGWWLIQLRSAITCRTKYYGVHLGEPDIAATPFKDEPLMIHRSVQQSASLLRILQEASLMLYMTPCRPIRELLHQATAIIC